MTDYSKYISKLDTERFGFKVAKLNCFDEAIETIISKLKENGVKLLLSRIKGNDIELLNKLEDYGFRVKDNQVTYRFDIENLSQDLISRYSNCKVREVEEKDIPSILKFTEQSFNGYGHYFADKRLDRAKCMEIYKDWIVRSCVDKKVADKVFVAEVDNEPAGYLSFKIYKELGSVYAAGGLGTVDKRFRNLSLFQAITVHGLKWGAEIGLDWEEHNVLTSNYPVNRAFSKLGFKIVSSYITLHCWL